MMIWLILFLLWIIVFGLFVTVMIRKYGIHDLCEYDNKIARFSKTEVDL